MTLGLNRKARSAVFDRVFKSVEIDGEMNAELGVAVSRL